MDHIGNDILAGIPPDLIPDEPAEILAAGDADLSVPDIDVPFTPAAQQVIDRCLDLADLVGGSAILSEHLLLAIASTPGCAAAKIIAEHDLSTDNLLSALQTLLGNESSAPPGRQESPRLERVIIRAKREAYRHSHAEVSTLHLLMALIRERASYGAQADSRFDARYGRFAGAFRHAAESD
jgi:ATP-dependent Clp protease ATP-binding subunit ClpA